jgi:hypothetical protein
MQVVHVQVRDAGRVATASPTAPVAVTARVQEGPPQPNGTQVTRAEVLEGVRIQACF